MITFAVVAFVLSLISLSMMLPSNDVDPPKSVFIFWFMAYLASTATWVGIACYKIIKALQYLYVYLSAIPW